jgi:hypothetical protein
VDTREGNLTSGSTLKYQERHVIKKTLTAVLFGSFEELPNCVNSHSESLMPTKTDKPISNAIAINRESVAQKLFYFCRLRWRAKQRAVCKYALTHA